MVRYHSLATSTYERSAFGSGVAGSTTIAPYMPLAMCIRTGLVPQWYMNTPGSPALKRKVKDLPGITSMNALFGAIRAAWKSIEWGIAPSFVSVISTVCPCRAWTTGPGAPPSKPQAAYLIPGAISIVTSFSTMCTLTTSPGVRGGSAAGYGVCALARSAAFSGAAPAKLWPLTVLVEPALMSMPAIVSSFAAAADDVPTVFSARSDATSDATHNSTPAASTPSPRSGTLITCSFCIVDFRRQDRRSGRRRASGVLRRSSQGKH